MAREQKLFLKRVRENWRITFPFLKLVDLDEVPKIPKGCNFRCDNYLGTRGVYYFVTFVFSSRRHGEFSLGVTVSSLPDKSVLSPPNDYTPTPTNVGSYSVAEFLNKQSFRWDLVDVDARTDAILKEFGIPSMTTPDYIAADVSHDRVLDLVWKPSSYTLPFDQVADEAIRDVNDKLCRFVFPKLQIA